MISQHELCRFFFLFAYVLLVSLLCESGDGLCSRWRSLLGGKNASSFVRVLM